MNSDFELMELATDMYYLLNDMRLSLINIKIKDETSWRKAIKELYDKINKMQSAKPEQCISERIKNREATLFHHSIYLWLICFPWWSIDELENLHEDRTTVCF